MERFYLFLLFRLLRASFSKRVFRKGIVSDRRHLIWVSLSVLWSSLIAAKMREIWKFHRFRDRAGVFCLVVICLSFGLCWSLNDEGLALLSFREKIVNDPFSALLSWRDEDGRIDPCSWFGVGCSDGKVVSLNLIDLCLEGTLTPELRRLVHAKSIILRNNTFSGIIPQGIGDLEELEMLDLRHNCFSGPLPSDLNSNPSRGIILLDENKLQLLRVQENGLLSSAQSQRSSFDKNCHSRHASQAENVNQRRLLQENAPLIAFVSPPKGSDFPPAFRSPSPPASVISAPQPRVDPTPVPPSSPPPPPPDLSPPLSSPSENGSSATSGRKSSSMPAGVLVVIIGGAVFLTIFGVCMYLFVFKKVPVRPWAMGLSGQLQKAFVTGVPKLKRSELETACEDFSNVIGVTPVGTVYKGTLSSGVEIAVACLAAKSASEWPHTLELQFRKKIDTLSKVNHKNFVNLIGYCEDEEPFARMMVFEYAPNGTLFEHLHIQESEHLDWGMRLRIAVGMASCLEHMHQLNPPIIHNNLTSSAVCLTEDYAAKLAEMSFWNETVATERESLSVSLVNIAVGSSDSNVYSFGVILFEMMTGRLPYSVDDDSLEDWASDYLRGEQTLQEIVDPTLKKFNPEQLELIGQVIKSCSHPDWRLRPEMADVSLRLRSITGISQEEATPRLSPLWWAELEIMSTEAQ